MAPLSVHGYDEPMTSFKISGLDARPFEHLFGLGADELGALGVWRYTVDEQPGFPDRVELRDADVGQSVLLVHYMHQPAQTPYRASHAIFIREGATERFERKDVVPAVLRSRVLSLRAFDRADMMVDADLRDGRDVEVSIARLFARPDVAYIQAHFAARGCYAARIDRA